MTDCLSLWQNVEDGMFKILLRVTQNPERVLYDAQYKNGRPILDSNSPFQFPLIEISASFNNALSVQINEQVMNENRPRIRILHILLPLFTSHRKYE